VRRPRLDHTRDVTAWDGVRPSYDRVAAKYEARFLHELDDKPRDRAMLEAFASSVGDPVMEIGCGPGQVGAFVRGLGRVVIGVDLSLEMAKHGHRRLDAVVAADMRALPLAGGRAAAILAFYSLIHLSRREVVDVLREFRRTLRPGGRVFVSAHEGRGELEVSEFLDEPVAVGVTLFELDELVAASQAAGLDVLVAERRAPYPTEGERFRLYLEAERPDDDR